MSYEKNCGEVSHKGLFQIGEVARSCGVSRKTILFYESSGLIAPTVSNRSSGYRYYSAEAVTRLALILQLRSAGLSIAEIGAYLSGGREATMGVIAMMERRLEALREGLESVRSLAVEPGDYTVAWSRRPAQSCLVREYVCRGVGDALESAYDAYGQALRLCLPTQGAHSIFAEYLHDFLGGQALELAEFSMRVCVPVLGAGKSEELVDFPAVTGIQVHHRGEYAGLGRAYAALADYVKENALVPAGPVREYYLDGGREHQGETDRHVTRIFLPVEDRRQT